jgi:hypothetical protein
MYLRPARLKGPGGAGYEVERHPGNYGRIVGPEVVDAGQMQVNEGQSGVIKPHHNRHCNPLTDGGDPAKDQRFGHAGFVETAVAEGRGVECYVEHERRGHTDAGAQPHLPAQ